METVHMNRPRSFRVAMVALIPAAAISLGLAGALAQSPPATPPAASAPAATPAPSTSAPAPTATPASAASPSAAPAPPPAAAETPAATPPAATVQTADPFGEEITLTPKSVVVLKGNANWDSAFDTLIESFKSLTALLDKQGIKPSG